MIKQQPKDCQLKLDVLCAADEKLEQIWSVSLNCVLPKSFIYCYRQKKNCTNSNRDFKTNLFPEQKLLKRY
jgi:hypothetical protein